MALVPCPECGEFVSNLAFACPHCGCPIKRPRPLAGSSDPPVGSFLHIAGLDLLKGTFCSLSCSPYLLTMSAPRRSFNIPRDRVLDVSVMAYRELLELYGTISTDEHTSQSVKDTMRQTIDVSAKKRFIQPHTKFLLITYTGEDDEGHIITFQLNDGNAKAAQRLASQYAEQAESQDVFL